MRKYPYKRRSPPTRDKVLKGIVIGNRGSAQRLGSFNSGMITKILSSELDVYTELFYNKEYDRQEVEIRIKDKIGNVLKAFTYIHPASI